MAALLHFNCRLQNIKKFPIGLLYRSLSKSVTQSKNILKLQTNSHSLVRNYKTHKKTLPFEVDSKVSKDTLLFTYRNDRFHRILGWFGIAQFAFWGYLAQFSYSTLRDAPREEGEDTEDLPWWRRINLGENKYRYGLTFMSLSLGYLILIGSWMYPLRTVRALTLLKGGNKVGLTTYSPLGGKRHLVVPLQDLTSLHARQSPGSYISIKVKSKWMFFLMDKRGKFHNHQLFDYVVGIKRVW